MFTWYSRDVKLEFQGHSNSTLAPRYPSSPWGDLFLLLFLLLLLPLPVPPPSLVWLLLSLAFPLPRVLPPWSGRTLPGQWWLDRPPALGGLVILELFNPLLPSNGPLVPSQRLCPLPCGADSGAVVVRGIFRFATLASTWRVLRYLGVHSFPRIRAAHEVPTAWAILSSSSLATLFRSSMKALARSAFGSSPMTPPAFVPDNGETRTRTFPDEDAAPPPTPWSTVLASSMSSLTQRDLRLLTHLSADESVTSGCLGALADLVRGRGPFPIVLRR